jgi:nicotinamidase-related amidase
MAEMAITGWKDGKWKVPDWKMDGKPALIVVHMQQGIVGKGTFSGAPHEQEIENIKEFGIVDKQKALLKAFRDKKLPVIFVNVLPNPLGFLPPWGFIFKMTKEKSPVGLLDNPALRAEVEVIPEMERKPSDYVLYHTGICAFTNSHLDIVLKHEGVKSVVITGYTGHSSVYNACIQAADLWYSVIIPRDSTGAPARDQRAFDAVMDLMAQAWALITTTEDVIAHL